MIDITTILTAGITASTTLAAIYLKDYFIPKKNKQVINADKTDIYIQLDKLAASCRDKLKAQQVYIAYFHNGGHFINGAKMDKYTIVGEDYDMYARSVKPTGVNRMVSDMSFNVHNLATRNQYYFEITTYKRDQCYVEWLRDRKMNAVWNVAIRNNSNDDLIGFISIEYSFNNDVTCEEAKEIIKNSDAIVWKYSNKAAKLVTDLKCK